MPKKPLRPCVVNGCRGFAVVEGYCEQHRHIPEEKKRARYARVDAKRGSSSSRGYDGQWQKVRAMKFRTNPLCEWCEAKGRVTAAEEIHHEIPIAEAPELRLDLDNLVSLCKRCHDTTKHG